MWKRLVLYDLGEFMNSNKPLSAEEILEIKETLPTWKVEGNTLVKEVEFKSLAEASNLIKKLDAVTHRLGHDPDITMSKGVMTICLTTHDIDSISCKDTAFAKHFDAITKEKVPNDTRFTVREAKDSDDLRALASVISLGNVRPELTGRTLDDIKSDSEEYHKAQKEMDSIIKEWQL